MKFVPAPRLVGIEPNPGPAKAGNRIPEEKRWRIIFKKKDLKQTPYKIAQEMKMNEQSVQNIEKYEQTGTVHDRPKSGRKRKLSNAQVSQAVRKAKKGKCAPQIARECETKVDPRTIRRRLKEVGLFYGKVLKVEKLTKRHKEQRVEYSKEMHRVFCSDEKTFQLGTGPSHAWQEHKDRVVREYVKHAPKLHVWVLLGITARLSSIAFKKISTPSFIKVF